MKKTLLLLINLIWICSSHAQIINIATVPRELLYSKHNDDFTVCVRTPGGEWQDLFEYKVTIDSDNPQLASMVQFDFEGKVEMRVRYNNGSIQNVKIRPIDKGIKYTLKENVIYFQLDKPSKLSLEINGDKLHNLHIFTNEPEKETFKADSPNVMYFGAGFHKPKDAPGDAFNIPSNTTVYLAPGAVIGGKFVCNRVENVRFIGRGIILEPQRGFEITYSKNIEIDGITVINPTHYTVYGGETTGLKINNLKSFSSRGWSDGIDLMSCSDVAINDIFMRNSDDCIAIYGHRWSYYGNARNYNITNSILWADVAHPINIGLHGNTAHEGDTIENIQFKNIDILEHDEDDRNYQGCMAFSVSDHNLVRNILFEDIRIDDFQEGQLLNLRVLFNEKYSFGPGRGIKDVTFRNIYYNGQGANPSIIEGFSETNKIENISFDNIVVNGIRIKSLKEGDIKVGKFVDNVNLK